MELGLRLGDGPPFGFHHKQPPSDSDPTNVVVSHTGLDFSLAFESIPPLQQTHNHNNHLAPRFFHPPSPSPSPSPLVLHLDLLPRTPVLASRRSSETDISEGAAAVFTDVISTAPPSGAAEGGGGESPRNPLPLHWSAAEEGNSDEDDQNLGSRKKLRLSRQQSAFLEESFKEHHTLYPKQKVELARRLNLRPRQVEVWFQNRRARTKLKQTEVDCEYLKNCCQTLTQQNTKLRKELQDLRALKTTDSLFMRSPATTLTMCASCERAAKEPLTSKASGFSFTRTGSFPFSRPLPSTHNN